MTNITLIFETSRNTKPNLQIQNLKRKEWEDMAHYVPPLLKKWWSTSPVSPGLAFEYQNTPLLVFHVFGLFTRRQNCKAFSLLRLV